jgi:homoserine kinase type II
MTGGAIVYVLFHERDLEDAETVKLLGVFSSKALALAAIAYYADKPGFRDYPNNFTIDPYTLDKLQWSEGFG